MQTKRRIKFSIFLKLVLLIIVFIIVANLLLGFFIRFSLIGPPIGQFNKKAPPHLHEFIVREIGYPPDTVKAMSFVHELNIGIRFETPEVQWSSNEDIPGIKELSGEGEFRNKDERHPFDYKGRPYFIEKIPQGFVILSPPMPRDSIDYQRAILAVIVIVSVLGLLLYFSLRWIFGPVKKLSEGVEKIGEGNFDDEIKIDRSDELGLLADSINKMKSNISGMIKAKESLLIDVSHELRSPLTRIKLANEFVDDLEIHNMIKTDVDEMEKMISGLLETYRMEKGEEKLNLDITDIVDLTKNVISKFNGAKIIFESEFKERKINIDRAKIEIVLRNLLDNAIKYSEGKQVEVKISGEKNNGDKTLLSIRDYGNGIAAGEIEKIFEPFYRIDKSRDKKISGYGLGLSLVKKILDLHKVVISIQSEPAQGTRFLLTFKS